jgi:16S rRNA (guanine527-N7)-methyltransferase
VTELSDRLHVLLGPAAARYGVDLAIAGRPLAIYAKHLLAWNRRINLTGARDLETLAAEHLADAFPVSPHLERGARCVDVGSGAGLPGVVLAIVRPDLEVVLLEPTQKRRAFLSSVLRELELAHATVVAERLEDHAHGAGRSAYDAAMARAVLPLAEWLDVGRALVRRGGAVLGFAGSREEALPVGAARVAYDVGAGERAVVIVRV